MQKNEEYKITLRFEKDKSGPSKGWWLLFYHTPEGIVPFRTQRNTHKKFRQFYDAMKWIAEHRPGYTVNIEMLCYSGSLIQTRNSSQEP